MSILSPTLGECYRPWFHADWRSVSEAALTPVGAVRHSQAWLNVTLGLHNGYRDDQLSPDLSMSQLDLHSLFA